LSFTDGAFPSNRLNSYRVKEPRSRTDLCVQEQFQLQRTESVAYRKANAMQIFNQVPSSPFGRPAFRRRLKAAVPSRRV
jgi:hypothetical protein